MKQLSWLLVIALFSLAVWSCQNNNSIPTPTTGSIAYSWNGGGCNIVITLDGGSPITETATTGNATLYSSIPNGSHTVAIAANGTTNTCTINVSGDTKKITENGVCTSPLITCPY